MREGIDEKMPCEKYRGKYRRLKSYKNQYHKESEGSKELTARNLPVGLLNRRRALQGEELRGFQLSKGRPRSQRAARILLTELWEI